MDPAPKSPHPRKCTAKRNHCSSSTTSANQPPPKKSRNRTKNSEGPMATSPPVTTPRNDVTPTEGGPLSTHQDRPPGQEPDPPCPQAGITPTLDPAHQAQNLPSALAPPIMITQDNLLEQLRLLIGAASAQNARDTMTDQPGTSSGGPPRMAPRVTYEAEPGECLDSNSSGASDNPEFHSGDEELILSEDEQDYSEPTTTSGLFRHELFKSILNKAKTVTQLGGDPQTRANPTTSAGQDAKQLLFATQSTKTEEIPAPAIFTDLVYKQWELPAAGRPPLNSEQRFYNVEETFNKALNPPTVDEPVVTLTATHALITDADDALKVEDRKVEQTLRRGHLAAAWAIKASTTASFFNRASLLWLRQLQERTAIEDLRTHQDINKLIAALELSADATLHAAKFAARSIGSVTAARRLIWLKPWPADLKTKWKLSSAPFKGDKLFGDALNPVLTETREGKKKLSMGAKNTPRRRTPFFRRQSFRQFSDQPQPSSSSSYQRPYQHRTERQFQPYRGRQQPYQNKQYQGGKSGRSFRRNK